MKPLFKVAEKLAKTVEKPSSDRRPERHEKRWPRFFYKKWLTGLGQSAKVTPHTEEIKPQQ
jgi:hypothetical protein